MCFNFFVYKIEKMLFTKNVISSILMRYLSFIFLFTYTIIFGIKMDNGKNDKNELGAHVGINDSKLFD